MGHLKEDQTFLGKHSGYDLLCIKISHSWVQCNLMVLVETVHHRLVNSQNKAVNYNKGCLRWWWQDDDNIFLLKMIKMKYKKKSISWKGKLEVDAFP